MNLLIISINQKMDVSLPRLLLIFSLANIIGFLILGLPVRHHLFLGSMLWRESTFDHWTGFMLGNFLYSRRSYFGFIY